MKKISYAIIIYCLFLSVLGVAQIKKDPFQKKYIPLKSQKPLGDRIVYFFTLLHKIPNVAQTLQNDAFFKKLTIKKIESFKKTVSFCDGKPECFISNVVWSEDEIETIAQEFKRLYSSSTSFKELVNLHLRPCGFYELYKNDTGEEILVKVWKDAANATNYIIKAYATGTDLLYPKIDSSTYDVKSAYYIDLLNQLFKKEAIYGSPNYESFFEPSLSIAILLLEINNRNEAIRFFPLNTINAQAFNEIKNTHWNKYPYSAILVLGEGPEYDNIAISPHGKIRCQIAAAKFKAGVAPFIIVSGGQVHPFQTPYCEAIEMRKYLIEQCGVPSTSIIVDPHARHTTTNFRNTNRIVFRNNFPINGKLLFITSKSHLDYITNEKFNKRCMDELGYLPYMQFKRLGQFEAEYLPTISSLHLKSNEPLDP